ncbi:MAG: hypothetical protein Q9208_002906 [Pyrenodesmia sp. 3 TL-2023]
MEHIPIANLEAELGFFHRPSLNAGLRYDHGDPRKPFDAPAGSTSCLNPPSKTKSFHSFGANGTVGWTTAAGELLQVASCIDNKLIGAEYRKSIQRGFDYVGRGKMLETAVNAPQGSGYGIGLSLRHAIEPLEKSWVHNRWPRFTYRHNGLDIRLQYYIDSNTVMQEYQVRNAGQEEVELPYIYSSDICFREHGSIEDQAYPVPTGKSRARLLLFQNSQVLVKNNEQQCQVTMAFFLNAQRQSLWAFEKRSSGRGQGKEDSWRLATFQRELDPDRQEAAGVDFCSLIVPPGSTQELRTVIQVSALSECRQSEPYMGPTPKTENNEEDHQKNGNTLVESNKERLRSRQRTLVDTAKQLSLGSLGQGANQEFSKFINEHLELGQACSMLKLVGEARYHLFSACLIAEYLCNKEDSYDWIHSRFVFSEFLYDHGWPAMALEFIEPLFHTLSNHKSNAEKFIILREKVQYRLATMYLKMNEHSKAESMYKNLLPELIGDEMVLDPLSAHYLERLAWLQVRQQKFEAAYKNYSLLLPMLPETRRQVVLSNLGFIELRLGNIRKAKSFFEDTLKLGDTSTNSMEQLYARSALYACLDKLGTRPEDDPQIACSLMRYVDFDALLFRSSSAKITMDSDGPFHFAMFRHLETLLSSCSVPVENHEGTAGIAFLDADPLDSSYSGSNAYFQFKFLTQCQLYINARQAKTALYSETSERIKHACRAHLIWVFKIAELRDTWDALYPVGGGWIGSKVPADERTESRTDQGAFQFSKIWLYLKAWSQDWVFALEQLQPRLEGWLLYVRTTQYMGNLWAERSDYDDLKPYDTISPDNNLQGQLNPQYLLSDFTMLWLALKQLENLIDLIERSCGMEGRHEDDPIKRKVNEVRKIFDDHQKYLGIEAVRSNVLKTFIVSESNQSAFHSKLHQKIVSPSQETFSTKAQAPLQVDIPERSPYVENFGAEGVTAFQEFHTSKPSRQLIAFTRSVSQFDYNIQYTDIATIEAAAAGFFDVSQEYIGSAWQTALKMQLESYIAGCNDPNLIALTLATKDVQKHDGPLPALQLPQDPQPSGSRAHQGSFIPMPPQVGTSPMFARKNVVGDDLFQPKWMYFPHVYLHQFPLEIDCEMEFELVESIQGFKNAIASWRESKKFNTTRILRGFPPHVADSGTKKGAVFDGKPLERQMDIQWYGSPAEFYNRLTEPRTFDSAKKRLIEFTSFHQDLSLICWLTSPTEQKTQFLEFLRRHGCSESFFGERVDWRGNIWETELHLGFYQLLNGPDNDIYHSSHLDYQGQFRVREMPSLSRLFPARKITPVTTSLRFVGDLRDQAWTCYFLSSVARDYGFSGLVDEYTDDNGELTDTEFHKEKMAQRKILEMAYVDRMLIEIVRSCEAIFESFQKELTILETRDLQSESYELIHIYSRLHLKIGELFPDVLKLLNLSVGTVENWEKREDSRDIRSRWSQKDEARYGPKLVHLARKCKAGIQSVRVQRDLLKEQQKLAEQQHDRLINYMSLKLARTSSQSAEDVRLLTYVTIFFVPLSFSSSLFSMGGAPERSTISVMIPTTVIALAVTILALAIMKVQGRNRSFGTYKMNALARRKMLASEASWGFAWEKISRQLEETAELRLADPDDKKDTPALSRWWYILFWISYALGVLSWAFVSVREFLVVLAAKLLGQWLQVMRWLRGKVLGESHSKVEAASKRDASGGGEEPLEVSRKNASIGPAEEPDDSNSTSRILARWLQVSRPLRRLTGTLKVSPGALDNAEPQMPSHDSKVEPLIQSDQMLSEEDRWEMLIEKKVVAKGETLASQAQPGVSVQRRTSGGSYKEKSPWWARMKKSREATESKV